VRRWLQFVLLLLGVPVFAHVPDRYLKVYVSGEPGPATRFGGVELDYLYDRLGQLTNAAAFEPGRTATRLNETFGYAYDPAGDLRRRINGATTNNFYTDRLNQLTNATRSSAITVSGTLSTNGNTVRVNGVNATVYHDLTFSTTSGVPLSDGPNTLTTTAIDQYNRTPTQVTTVNLPQSVTLFYDANGNLTNDGLRRFEYDGADRLSAVYVPNAWRAEFFYDGLSRTRITKEYNWQGAWAKTNETRYVYLGRLVVQERNSADNPTVTYTRGLDLSGTWDGAGGIGGLLARTDSNGSAFYHNDGAGNITALINSAGQIQARYAYDPFGNLVSKRGPLADANVYRFSSKEHLPNAGLYYYGFRFYDPNLQRWLNQDPIGLAGGVNLYRFVGNDPLNFVDLLGLATYPEGFIGPMQPEDFLIGGGGNYTMRVSPNGELLPTDGGGEDLSLDFYDLFNFARSIPRSLKDLAQPAVCWAKKKAAETLEKNKAAGKAFEKEVENDLKAKTETVAPQITLETKKGTKTRMDFVTKDASGNIGLTEAKSSGTAPLTPNQSKAFPEIGKTGATVKGEGKPAFPGGTLIPPTKVDVTRP